MIKTDATAVKPIKAIREREKKEKEESLRKMCETLAKEKFGETELVKMSNENRGLWYLPILNDAEDTIETMLLMRPINRHILSFATTKIQDEGLYTFLEQCMRECFVASVEPDGATNLEGDKSAIIEDDEYFIPASNKFNGIIEGKKAALLKR